MLKKELSYNYRFNQFLYLNRSFFYRKRKYIKYFNFLKSLFKKNKFWFKVKFKNYIRVKRRRLIKLPKTYTHSMLSLVGQYLRTYVTLKRKKRWKHRKNSKQRQVVSRPLSRWSRIRFLVRRLGYRNKRILRKRRLSRDTKRSFTNRVKVKFEKINAPKVTLISKKKLNTSRRIIAKKSFFKKHIFKSSFSYIAFSKTYLFKKYKERLNMWKVRVRISTMNIRKLNVIKQVSKIIHERTYNITTKSKLKIFKLREERYRFNKAVRRPYVLRFYFHKSIVHTLKGIRKIIDRQFNLKTTYQQQITKFLWKCGNKFSIHVMVLRARNAVSILESVNLFKNKHDLNLFFIKKLIYINGETMFSKKTQLIKGDWVSVYISWKILLYLTYSTYLFINYYKDQFFYYFKFVKKRKRFNKPYQYWPSRFKKIDKNLPDYLEMDYLTLSFFMIKDITSQEVWKYYTKNTIPVNILANLNWKFIT